MQPPRPQCFHLVNLVGWNRLSSPGHNHFSLQHLLRHASTMSSSKRQRTAPDDNDPSISPPPVKRKVQSTVTSMCPTLSRASLSC